MTIAEIPSMTEIGAGIGLVADGACDMASSAVQDFVSNPSTAEMGLSLVAAQIEVLEKLVEKLRQVAAGIGEVEGKLEASRQMEWQSPAGQAFREAVQLGQDQARNLQETSQQTVGLANQGIEELRLVIAGLQSLLATARTSMGSVADSVVTGVCS